jgi:LysM repeat protein
MRKIIVLSLIALFAVLVLTSASPSPTSAAAPFSYYVVRPGDTLATIAWRYGTSSWSLARANGIWDPNRIYVGQMLTIPSAGYCYNCNYHPYPYYSQPYYPRSYGCSYWVRYGDTLSTIAWRYGGDPWVIARANGLYNLNWIYAGQRLVIPGCN